MYANSKTTSLHSSIHGSSCFGTIHMKSDTHPPSKNSSATKSSQWIREAAADGKASSHRGSSVSTVMDPNEMQDILVYLRLQKKERKNLIERLDKKE